MKQSVSKYDFERAFSDCGRQDQFSYEALGLLYDFFEDLDEQCDTETELDVIAICCDFYEADIDDIASDYNITLDEDLEEDEREETVLEYLNDNTMVVGQTSGTIVYQAF